MNKIHQDSPLVSVIIPCYNAERWLAEAIESALTQTYQHLEVIVVNDGSTDESQQIIESFGDSIIAVQIENKGGNHARNLGFRLSKGDYIQYLDADDVLMPDKIARQLSVLCENGADIAYGNWRHLIHEQHTTRFGDLISPQIGVDKLVSLITDFWCPPLGYLFTRQIVQQSGGWDEDAKAIQDVCFMIDVVKGGANFAYVDVLTGYYRRYGNVTVSTRSAYNFNQGCYLNALKLEIYWRENNLLTPHRREALSLVYGQVARYFFQYDQARFEEVYDRLRTLNKRYIPLYPAHLRVASLFLGYRNAEHVARWYRGAKQLLGVAKTT